MRKLFQSEILSTILISDKEPQQSESVGPSSVLYDLIVKHIRFLYDSASGVK